jgi:hypothetical protein
MPHNGVASVKLTRDVLYFIHIYNLLYCYTSKVILMTNLVETRFWTYVTRC